jgi:magnesium-transporting ATPase (P-type)
LAGSSARFTAVPVASLIGFLLAQELEHSADRGTSSAWTKNSKLALSIKPWQKEEPKSVITVTIRFPLREEYTDMVPDDLLRLSAGDLVPADAKLLESHDLCIQQAALPG